MWLSEGWEEGKREREWKVRGHTFAQTLAVFYITIVKGTVRSIPGHFWQL